jgi:hypothetical protein
MMFVNLLQYSRYVNSGSTEIFMTHHSQIVQEVVGWLDRYVGRVQ